jgi:hypothetical protein
MRKLCWSFLLCCFVMLGINNLWAGSQPASLQQLAELTPTIRNTNDWFGTSIAISGNTVVVGDYDSNIEQYGAVYVYVKPSGGWTNMTQVAVLTSSDNGQGFGTSVAISGNTIVVGAADTSNFDPSTPGPGAAYVFVEPAGGWTNMTETAKLTASDGQSGDAFGDSVSISGNTVAVGAFFATDSSGNNFAGRAYVFVRPGGGWNGSLTQTAELTASDSVLLNYMGCSVATNGNTVIAGAEGHNNFAGSAYVFSRPASGWTDMTQTAELSASNAKGSSNLGFSTALSGNTVLLGAPGANNFKGAGYLYIEPSGGWIDMTETAQLHSPMPAQNSFSQSVVLSPKLAVVGAPGATIGANSGQGAAYVYIRPASGWKTSSHAIELTASDGTGNDNFGLSVGVSGTTIVSGQIGNSNPGAAYVFGQ